MPYASITSFLHMIKLNVCNLTTMDLTTIDLTTMDLTPTIKFELPIGRFDDDRYQAHYQDYFRDCFINEPGLFYPRATRSYTTCASCSDHVVATGPPHTPDEMCRVD